MKIFTKIAEWFRRPLPTTRVCARLGVIAATLCGGAMALHLRGVGGYLLPLTALLGAPANAIVMGFLHFVHPVPRGMIWSGAPWNIYLLLFCSCVALNWALVGFMMDIGAGRPPIQGDSRSTAERTPELVEPNVDPLVRDFDELEKKVRERSRPIRHRASRRAA